MINYNCFETSGELIEDCIYPKLKGKLRAASEELVKTKMRNKQPAFLQRQLLLSLNV
jgi:hypothetical protein